jgi:DNA-binding GntR family transcriptional regulator
VSTIVRWAPVDLGSCRPAYQQIADQIRRAITSGRLPAGSLVPSETELMTLCRTSRVTARRAIQAVRDEGLLITRQGRGSYVRDTATSKVLVRRISPDECSATGRDGPCTATGHVHEHVQARMPTVEERDRLRIAAGVPVLVITQQRHGSVPAKPDLVLPADRITVQYHVGSPAVATDGEADRRDPK